MKTHIPVTRLLPSFDSKVGILPLQSKQTRKYLIVHLLFLNQHGNIDYCDTKNAEAGGNGKISPVTPARIVIKRLIVYQT